MVMIAIMMPEAMTSRKSIILTPRECGSFNKSGLYYLLIGTGQGGTEGMVTTLSPPSRSGRLLSIPSIPVNRTETFLHLQRALTFQSRNVETCRSMVCLEYNRGICPRPLLVHNLCFGGKLHRKLCSSQN